MKTKKMMSKSKPSDKRQLLNISVQRFIEDYFYRIDLDADYQREKIWTEAEQKLLLDSILSDIDIPKIYLAKTQKNREFDYECIDGKQRMTALLRFFKPEPEEESPLTVRHLEKEYSYKEFKLKHPEDAKMIEEYELSFVIYPPLDDEYIRKIFRRLQLGIRLNSGELLKTRMGTIRDFIYKEIGNEGPFFRYTSLSKKRFSRPFTLAQICINSFQKSKHGDFVRARLRDLEDFFESNCNLDKDSEDLQRIRKTLKIMDKSFGEDASNISSRAIAVTAYLFIEELIHNKKKNRVADFSRFYVKLLEEIELSTELLSSYEKPKNPLLMEEFQKYVLQASVEAYSIKRRHDFLKKAFGYYLDSTTKGKIIGSK